jgi:hypothetical protein
MCEEERKRETSSFFAHFGFIFHFSHFRPAKRKVIEQCQRQILELQKKEVDVRFCVPLSPPFPPVSLKILLPIVAKNDQNLSAPLQGELPRTGDRRKRNQRGNSGTNDKNPRTLGARCKVGANRLREESNAVLQGIL